MKLIDENLQAIAVKKILEEMRKAEQLLIKYNISCYEQLLDSHCLPLYYELSGSDVREMERKYGDRYKLFNAFYNVDSIGVPLIKKTLIGNNLLTAESNISFECEFGKIEWDQVGSSKVHRHFVFNNDGNIFFSKDDRVGETLRHPKSISYNATFNVLSNDFDMQIKVGELLDDANYKHKYEYYTLAMKNDNVIHRYNDIETITNLNTGTKLIKIKKDTSIAFDIKLNSNNELENCSFISNTHKTNGKINGTYRFNANKDKGISFVFYSRKGNKKDLLNGEILNKLNNILFALNINDLMCVMEKIISKDMVDVNINFSNYNLQFFNQLEQKTINMVKCIKGELPLSGLNERITNCLPIIKNIEIQRSSGKFKILKLN